MSKQGWVVTTRGKGGGISLARTAQDYRLGQTVSILENNHSLVNCDDPPCILRNTCRLKSALNNALQAFFDYLDQYTLADMIKIPVEQAIIPHNRIQMLDLMSLVDATAI